jgi:glutamine synthetase
MKLIPEPKTAYLDRFTGAPYSRDPRNNAAKAEAYLKSTGIADVAYFGPEPEYYIFDDVHLFTGRGWSWRGRQPHPRQVAEAPEQDLCPPARLSVQPRP